MGGRDLQEAEASGGVTRWNRPGERLRFSGPGGSIDTFRGLRHNTFVPSAFGRYLVPKAYGVFKVNHGFFCGYSVDE
jgi:hypothetical protein